MSTVSDLDRARGESIASSGAGFPFLFSFGLSWLGAGALSYALPAEPAAWVYILQAFVAVPLALGLQSRLRYPKASPDNPLWPLAAQLLAIQAVAFPAYIVVLELEPTLVPVVFAALVGAHFLPFQWLYQTRVYSVLGGVVAVGPWVLAVAFGKDVVHYAGFFVGPVLLAASFLVKAHAARRARTGVGSEPSGAVATTTVPPRHHTAP